MPEQGVVLRLKGVSKSFGGVSALDGVSFELRTGEVHALVGENGAGKSTLIKLIGGVHQPDSGTIEVDGVEYSGLTPDRSRALGISIVHQEFNLLSDLTVAENIFLGGQPRGRLGLIGVRGRRKAASDILARLGADLDPERLVRHLTIGEQQIVEVAKALAASTRVLVMDEPSAVLPDSGVERLFRVVEALRAEGTAVIYISHRLVEIFNIGQRVTVMKDGRVVTTRDVADTGRVELVNLMVGRPLSEQFPERQATPGGVLLLEVRGLTVPGCIIDVDLEVRAGEIVGLAGLGGSGRTTLAKALVGLVPTSSGEVRFLGRRAPEGPAAAARQGLVLVPEDRKATGLIMGRNVTFNVGLPSLRRLQRLGVLRPADEAAMATDAVKRFDVRPSRPQLAVENLSGGNQQKVVLAKWLATDPRLIVLDEPTRGIDVGAKAEIYRLIEGLSERGLGLLVISSELTELLSICDRIVVMHEGRVAGQLPRSEATEEKIMHLATGGAHVFGAEGGGMSAQAGTSRAALAERWILKPLSNERLRRSGAVLLIYALTVAVYAYTAFHSPSFRDPAYLSVVLRQSVVLGLVAIGQMVVILTGGIDMSIGMIARIVVLVVALNFNGQDSMLLPLVAVGLGLGAGVGFLNGILITRVHAVPFILTLGTFGILTGIGLAITSSPVGVIPLSYLSFYDAQLGPLPVSVVGMVAVWVLIWVVINRTRFGRALFAVGGSPEIARLAAINVRRTQVLAYTTSGLCGAAAGLFLLARSGVGDPAAGTNLEFQSIVAVALGGTSLYGGRGSVVGVLGAVLLLTMISSVFDTLQISVFYQQLLLGALVLLAVAGYKTPGVRSS